MSNTGKRKADSLSQNDNSWIQDEDESLLQNQINGNGIIDTDSGNEDSDDQSSNESFYDEDDADSESSSGQEEDEDTDSSDDEDDSKEGDDDEEDVVDPFAIFDIPEAKEGDEEDQSVTVNKPDEYEYDSSDEEDVRNTIGNIPIEWYDDYKHIGYDIQGRKLIKPEKGDKLDDFLDRVDNPDYWRTVFNKQTGQKVLLSEEDVRQIKRIQASSHPMGSEGLYEPWLDFFSNEVMQMPVTGKPPDKRSFIPSKLERQKVGQLVHALKMGWMKPYGEIRKAKLNRNLNEPVLDLWKEDTEPEITRRYRMHIPAPKEVLPGHAESFNPPQEYLFDREEEERWDKTDPEDRRMNFKPQKFSSYRLVPSFKTFINERFSRLLDLYMASRKRKVKMQVNPEDLIPKRPDKKDLQPYPTREAVVYKGHTDMVRSISPDPTGQWLVSGSDDKTVRLWEVATGRCMKTLDVGGKVTSVVWNPNPAINLIVILVEKELVLINPGLVDKLVCSGTDAMLDKYEETPADTTETKSPSTWSVYDDIAEKQLGYRLKISHTKTVNQVTWHAKGDYFAVVQQNGLAQSVIIHQLSRRMSQAPFSRSKGSVQRVMFHPVHPHLFVATQQHVKVYNLVKQELHKKLQANCKYISSIDIHPKGDNVIVGSYDSRLCWFDMDLSTKAYQTLKYHKRAVRQVTYHKSYPLFASCSDDGAIIVSHGKVFGDLLMNPLIVTVKVLRGHRVVNHLAVLDCKFHPTQPWIFSSGADSTIRLYV